MSAPMRIGIAGIGTVGGAVLHILREHSELLAARAGRPLQVTALAVRDAAKPRTMSLAGIGIVTDAAQLATHPEVDVVVETIGGAEGIARHLVEAALAGGKPVVTANKALLAHHGLALAERAEAEGIALRFEAAVAGGIPAIAGIRQGLAANRIAQVAGILNGTCNYILTRMESARREFADVLAEAQALGYAEADPAMDVDGTDSAHKLALLAALSFGTAPDLTQVACCGIRHITLSDITYAAGFGYRIKLLGIAQATPSGVTQTVEPCLVPLAAPLAAVSGAFNAVQVEGDAVGRVVFEGRGAGGAPTASAVIADLVAIARGEVSPVFGIPAVHLVAAHAQGTLPASPYYVRLKLKDAPGALAEVTRVLAAQAVSVHRLTQYPDPQGASAEVVLITHAAPPAALSLAVSALAALPVSLADPVALRIED